MLSHLAPVMLGTLQFLGNPDLLILFVQVHALTHRAAGFAVDGAHKDSDHYKNRIEQPRQQTRTQGSQKWDQKDAGKIEDAQNNHGPLDDSVHNILLLNG